MKQTTITLGLLILISLLSITTHAKENPNGMTTDRVEIWSVSTKINEVDYEPRGSIVGGTNVYIRATGHNITPSKNSINIGPYPCIIEENGISGDLITCKTTHAFDVN
jgi:hypothetical protein